jgi:simple sugar transport system substrate-binding protein
VRAGAQQSAKDHSINLKYSNEPEAGKQATLVQNAIDSKVDGIAATLAFPDAVGPVLAKAAQAGIPTVVFNSGIDTYQKYAAAMYFGSDESLAGQSAGARLAQAGGGKALCVVHEQGNVSLETRCAGVKKSFPNTENIQVNGSDLPSVQQTIGAKLAQDPSITDIVTLDAGIAGAAVQAKAGSGSQAKIVTFDLSPDVVKDIQDKKIEFSVDQQPYLQGYLAVDSLWLQLTNGNDIGGGKPVLTGPSFVDTSNINKIAGFAANNTR